MRAIAVLLLISLALCQPVKKAGTNVYKESRGWAEIGKGEDHALEVKSNSYLNFDFPDDATDGSEWSVPTSKDLKLVKMIGQGHVYPSKETGTSIKRRTFSFHAVSKGTEDVIFQCAVKGKENEGKTYTIKFTII